MASKNPANATASLPPQIEIFRAGTHTDDAGVVHNFSAADVAGMVSSYDPAARSTADSGSPRTQPACLRLGQRPGAQRCWQPGHGYAPVQLQFAEMVDAKMFKKRSASFYPPQHSNNPKPGNWYLRHVAFLGAQPPAIAGLADFAEGDATGTVSFSESDPVFNQEQIRMTKELQDQLAASQAQAAISDAARTKAEGEAAEAKTKLAQFAEAAQRDRVAGFTSFCEAQIKAGCLLPKEKMQPSP
ncbi:hypothetical protein [Candidatus Aalborgicola defluviihabitans]|uniref:hypothetical protein n=1 Tax=Candidatus Aalborgicola defluviihabitans TaxID=3386187 RepID=UPI0039B86D61